MNKPKLIRIVPSQWFQGALNSVGQQLVATLGLPSPDDPNTQTVSAEAYALIIVVHKERTDVESFVIEDPAATNDLSAAICSAMSEISVGWESHIRPQVIISASSHRLDHVIQRNDRL